mmetsp:Transcript_50966/g.121074  ORF Transcript_50966/g.121074 Transcript_50966/m.121074 type:complete len:101 (+) Transcript_50966:530-832(+)
MAMAFIMITMPLTMSNLPDIMNLHHQGFPSWRSTQDSESEPSDKVAPVPPSFMKKRLAKLEAWKNRVVGPSLERGEERVFVKVRDAWDAEWAKLGWVALA